MIYTERVKQTDGYVAIKVVHLYKPLFLSSSFTLYGTMCVEKDVKLQSKIINQSIWQTLK